MAEPNINVTIETQITGKIADPTLVAQVESAINDGLIELAQIEGANKVKDQLYPGHGRVTGNLRNHIGSGLRSTLVAQVDAGAMRYGSNLVYAAWVEGVSTRNKSSRFKGYGMFRKMRERLASNKKAWEEYIGRAIMKVFE